MTQNHHDRNPLDRKNAFVLCQIFSTYVFRYERWQGWIKSEIERSTVELSNFFILSIQFLNLLNGVLMSSAGAGGCLERRLIFGRASFSRKCASTRTLLYQEPRRDIPKIKVTTAGWKLRGLPDRICCVLKSMEVAMAPPTWMNFFLWEIHGWWWVALNRMSRIPLL